VNQPPADPPVIDVHAHVVPPALIADLVAGRLRFPHVELRPHGDTHTVSFNGGTPTRPVAAGLTDLSKRLAWMAEQGVDRQVVGGWLDIFGYDLDEAEGTEWAQELTEAVAGFAAADPHFIALGTVPLQAPQRAAEAVRAQRAAGLPGIMIATQAGGRELNEPEFTPFWEAAHETGSVVFLHPGFNDSPRYTDFGLLNGLARLEDSTVTVARLLYSGIPARFPGVKLLIPHGGAALPYALGRLVRNHLTAPDEIPDPLESFRLLYFDSVVFDPAALEFLVTKVGADRVMLGSDYPFPIGDLAPRGVVERADLKDDVRARILGYTAAELFGEAARR
jgi:aminocarboxymuconate-semialdehyde decarboxylase